MLTVRVNYVISVVFIKAKILNPVCHLRSQESPVTPLTWHPLVPRGSRNHRDRVPSPPPRGGSDERLTRVGRPWVPPSTALSTFNLR